MLTYNFYLGVPKMKKFELINETRDPIATVHRIQYLKDIQCNLIFVSTNQFGGFLEKENNLCLKSNALILDDAIAFGHSKISGNAIVSDNARVCGHAKITDNAQISGNAQIYHNAKISGNAKIYGDVHIYGNAYICGNANISSQNDWFLAEKGTYILTAYKGENDEFLISFIHNDFKHCFHGNADEFLEFSKKHFNEITYKEHQELITMAKNKIFC